MPLRGKRAEEGHHKPRQLFARQQKLSHSESSATLARKAESMIDSSKKPLQFESSVTLVSGGSPPRERLTWAKVSRFLSLPFSPSRLDTIMQVKRFEDVPVKRLLEQGMKGILLDADGTLAPHHAREFSLSVLDHVRTMLNNGFKIAIYTNAWEDRFQAFQEMGVKVVTNVPAKPDPQGFHIAMTDFLQLEDPARVCMIGDNYVTDGGAIDAGMHFIHVRPVKGNEPFPHSAARFLAYLCAKMYGRQTAK